MSEEDAERRTLDVAKGVALIVVWITLAIALFRYGLGYVLDQFGFLEMLLALAAGIFVLGYVAVGIGRVFRVLAGPSTTRKRIK